MITWYILSPLDQLCESCPIPSGCRETDPRCPWRLAKATGSISRKKPVLCEVRILDYLERHIDVWHRIVDIAWAIGAVRSTVTSATWRLRRQGKVEHIGKGHTLRLRGIRESRIVRTQ